MILPRNLPFSRILCDHCSQRDQRGNVRENLELPDEVPADDRRECEEQEADCDFQRCTTQPMNPGANSKAVTLIVKGEYYTKKVSYLTPVQTH